MRKIIEKIKKVILLPKYLSIAKKVKRENCVILIGTSTYNNLGDHLLSRNSIEFLKNTFAEKNVVEIPTQIFKRYKIELSNAVNRNAIIIISAGGWMGNLWPEDELIMQEMICSFSNHKVMILPQTVYYDENLDNYQDILSQANRTYSKCVDLTLFVRERNSLNTAKSLLNIEHIYLAPDIGLYNKKSDCNEDRKCLALVCLRKDRETRLNNSVENIINEFLYSINYKAGQFDTIAKHNISNWCRNYHLRKLENELQKANIVFTDRLHGMILALNCGCKCVAFDNKNHKVSGVYNAWLIKNPNVILCDSNERLNFDRVRELINSSNSVEDWTSTITKQFDIMAQRMKGDI